MEEIDKKIIFKFLTDNEKRLKNNELNLIYIDLSIILNSDISVNDEYDNEGYVTIIDNFFQEALGEDFMKKYWEYINLPNYKNNLIFLYNKFKALNDYNYEYFYNKLVEVCNLEFRYPRIGTFNFEDKDVKNKITFYGLDLEKFIKIFSPFFYNIDTDDIYYAFWGEYEINYFVGWDDDDKYFNWITTTFNFPDEIDSYLKCLLNENYSISDIRNDDEMIYFLFKKASFDAVIDSISTKIQEEVDKKINDILLDYGFAVDDDNKYSYEFNYEEEELTLYVTPDKIIEYLCIVTNNENRLGELFSASDVVKEYLKQDIQHYDSDSIDVLKCIEFNKNYFNIDIFWDKLRGYLSYEVDKMNGV